MLDTPTTHPDRQVPDNQHVWQEIDAKLAELRFFKLRLEERRQAFLQGADELTQALAKLDRLMGELGAVDDLRKAVAT